MEPLVRQSDLELAALLAEACSGLVPDAWEDWASRNCFITSLAGAAALRRLGIDARAIAVDVLFKDLRNGVTATTDPDGKAFLETSGTTATPVLDKDAVGNGHAVIVTPGCLLDLTFGQFDSRGVALPMLLIKLKNGWSGTETRQQEEWWVVIQDRSTDTELRAVEQEMATTYKAFADGMYEALCTEIAQAGHN
jgi:hypothetical protein